MGELLAVVFGISAGILTLVGLTALFVSLNSQHNIQRCREVLWELEFLPNKYLDNLTIEISKEMYQSLIRYRNLSRDQGDIIPWITKIAQVSLIVVILSWIACGWLYIKDFNAISREFVFILTMASVLVLIEYLLLIGKLNSLNLVASLPTYEQVLNADFIRENPITPVLIASSTRLYFTRMKDLIMVDVVLAAEWVNYNIEVSIFNVTNPPQNAKAYKTQQFRIQSNDIYEKRGYEYRLRVAKIEEPQEGFLNILVKFTSLQGTARAEFWGINVIDIKNIEHYKQNSSRWYLFKNPSLFTTKIDF